MNEIARRVGKAPVKKAPVKKAPVKKAPVKKAPVKKAPVKKAPVKKAPVKKAATRERAATGPTMALPAPPSDPVTVLGLAEPFSAEQLRGAWRRYAARHHPDQGGDAATFTRGRTAYETLRRDRVRLDDA